jgi:hypothetical protein
MKILRQTFIAIIASLGLIAGTTPASAQTVSPGGPITASGQLTLSLIGGYSETVCDYTFSGTATATGFVLTSYTANQVSGSGFFNCSETIQLGEKGIVIDAVSSDKLNLEHIVLNTPFGDCEDNDISLDWANSGIVFNNNALILFCQASGTLTVSPTQTISN